MPLYTLTQAIAKGLMTFEATPIVAGVLRKNPKVHWNRDRRKDVPSAPWFKVFKGERINEHHLRLEEKRK